MFNIPPKLTPLDLKKIRDSAPNPCTESTLMNQIDSEERQGTLTQDQALEKREAIRRRFEQLTKHI